MAWLEVLHGGLLTTVQDLGRPGFAAMGLSQGGAMDAFMLQATNLVVGNPASAAALEFTLDGPVLAAHGDVVAAVGVLGGEWFVNGPEMPLPLWQAVLVRDGTILVVGAVHRGVRGYLAVAGGIDVDEVLGSRSTHLAAHLGGIDGRALVAGDQVPVGTPKASCEELVGRTLPPALRPRRAHSPIRVMMGPQDGAFTAKGLRTFLHAAYRVSSRIDRTGARLAGPPIDARAGYDIISDATVAGSVQVSGDGQPVVLLVERPTTGGYPKVATVITADLDAMGQARSGQHVRFLSVDEATARQAQQERQRALDRVRAHLQSSLARPAGSFVVSTPSALYHVDREVG